MKKIIISIAILLLAHAPVYANPTFYFDEGAETVVEHDHSVSLFIDTDGNRITAASTVINLPQDYLVYKSFSLSDYPSPSPYPNGTKPNCFSSLIDPSLGLGYKSSPYHDEDNFKIYISCGFPNPGYLSQSAGGDKLATLTFHAGKIGTGTLSFNSANTKFYYSSSSISPGAMPSYFISVLDTIEATPAPGEIPSKATDSITAGDLKFVEIGTNNASGVTVQNTTTENPELEVVEEDNTIPPPPDDLPPRTLPVPLGVGSADQEEPEDQGEVLSAQSLRELLIPGKSTADKTVVLINLISALTFLLILGIVIWKLISVKRISQLKTQHMSELLMSELATLESKMGAATLGPAGGQIKTNLGETIKKISQEVSETT